MATIKEGKQDPASDPAAPEHTTGADKTLGANRRYRVKSSGISTRAGTVWQGEEVTAAQLGDAARVQALLDRGSIELL